jgi:GT2 family glycosyltransferase
MSEAPRVAVIVVNTNEGGFLRRTLPLLERQTLPPHRIIVVDNGSTDGSPDEIEERHPRVEVLRLGRNAGFAAANNAGVRAAEDADWVGLLNPDAYPEPGWLEALVRTAVARPAYSMLASRQLSAEHPDLLDGAGDLYHVSGLSWRRDEGRPADGPRVLHAGEVFSPCAASALYRRDAFLSVGGLDEQYFVYFCDTDLAFRLRLAGHRCWYVPEAVVRHVGSGTTGRVSDFTVYLTHRNLIWTYVKDMPPALFWAYLPQHLAINLLLLVRYALRGQARAALSARLHALRGLPRVIRQRRRVQRGRTASALELRSSMATGLAAFPARR